jgi:uncharacterized protein YbjT (DUF2867 family)
MLTHSPTVLLLGADGFIGRHLAYGLRRAGYHVICVAKRPQALAAMGFETLAADFTLKLFQTKSFWDIHLPAIDHVVNAAGLLHGATDAFEAVHITAPKALYDAMRPTATGVLISAVGLNTTTKFAKYRRAGEGIALAANISVLRCGLVLGDTAYGGSALIRALAATPIACPIPAGPDPQFNPIHADDLAAIIVETLQTPIPEPIEIGGPQSLGLRDLLGHYRGWLGLPKPRFVPIPSPIMSLLGAIGDLCNMGPISRTSLTQMKSGVLADTAAMATHLKFQPRPFSTFANTRPSGTGDLWHARLYLAKPLLRLTLAFLWLASGLIGLLLPADSFLPLLPDSALSETTLTLLARFGGLFDIAIALALIRNWHPKRLAAIQIALVLGYSAAFTLLAPALWLLPLGGLLKNIPILALLAIHRILEKER